MIATPQHPLTPNAVAPSPLLAAKLAALRRKQVGVAVMTGVALAVVVSVELLALMLFVDWWLDLPWGVRLVSLLVQGAVLGFILFRFVLIPLLRQPDDDALGLLVEKARPEFRRRLIASIQLPRPGAIPPGASTSLAEATIEQTEAIAAGMDFQKVVATEKLLKLGLMAATVLFMAAGAFYASRAVSADLLKRAWLSHTPVPRKTRIAWATGNLTVGIGDSVRLEGVVNGVVPPKGRVVVKSATRRAQEFTLDAGKDKTRFSRTIDNVQETFNYTLHLNDATSPGYQVRAIPRPTVASIECEQTFPAYTKLKSARRPLGDLMLLAGSRLSLHAKATKDLQRAAIRLIGPETSVPLPLNSKQPRELAGEFLVPPKGLNGFALDLLDTEGMTSKDSAVYRVEVIPDKPPAVRITHPERKEELLTRQATMILGCEVTDDFAIAKLRLRYKINNLDNGAEKTVEFDLGGETPTKLKRRHEWKIGAFSPLLPEGSLIEYWIEAEDNNDATGPGLGSSEHQLAKIVSENEKRADLLNRAGDYLGSISDVTNDQEKLNRNLGTIILEKGSAK